MLEPEHISATRPRCVALIVAAGKGARFGDTTPKQYARLAGRPVLRRSVEAFMNHPRIDAVRVVIDPSHAALYAEATEGLSLLEPVAGGATRQDSVRLGLESLEPKAPDLVLIHDAARPLVSAAVIDAVIDALAEVDGALPVLRVVDTLKRVEAGLLVGDQPREGLARAQTPQGFRFATILDAHRRHRGHEQTDDTMLLTALGIPVRAVPGEERNLKITTGEDLAAAARHLAPARRWRTGSGFDVHRLVPGRRLMLGGIEIPHELGLDGHSDADVALHAITDALLGAISAGDIGQHFPPSDERWRDADSATFLAHAASLVAHAGGTVEHVDLTILCERPKIAPHRTAMQARIAAILGLRPDQVSIKATTTEGLGFTGRREGIVAQAVASVALDG
ncbi:MAG: bifunctional 2-C-methyl-D-erythritol 4-phosphate cytidylyltransferase/2-C-methyl-D-erythritol 2,4-cyclodiphosphate synthase [Geminicoccaceae bacterium]